MKKSFDEELLSATGKLRSGYTYLLGNLGKLTAAFTALLTALLVFTDIEFLGINSKEFSTTLILVLISTYVCYFSLEEAGERLFEESEEYQKIKSDYEQTAEKITVEMLPRLREYLSDYADEEFKYRQGQMLLSRGLSREELTAYLGGEPCERKKQRSLRQIAKAKRLSLTPELLLTASPRASELKNPKKTKYPTLIARILPSTVCMIFTVSVVLTFKEMTLEGIIEALVKLSTIPVAAFRGYAGGYNYKKLEESPYVESKTRLLRGFLDTKCK